MRESDGEGACPSSTVATVSTAGDICLPAWLSLCVTGPLRALSPTLFVHQWIPNLLHQQSGFTIKLHIFRLFLLNTYILLPAISSFFSGSVAKTPAFVSIHQLSHTAGTEDKTETRTLAHCPRLNWDSLVSCRPFTFLGLGWRVERIWLSTIGKQREAGELLGARIFVCFAWHLGQVIFYGADAPGHTVWSNLPETLLLTHVLLDLFIRFDHPSPSLQITVSQSLR